MARTSLGEKSAFELGDTGYTSTFSQLRATPSKLVAFEQNVQEKERKSTAEPVDLSSGSVFEQRRQTAPDDANDDLLAPTDSAAWTTADKARPHKTALGGPVLPQEKRQIQQR